MMGTAQRRRTSQNAAPSVGASKARASHAICSCESGMMPPPGVARAMPPSISNSRNGHSMRPLPRRSPMNS